jgi:Pyridoxamine 5'-phosphate oxidase
MSSNLMAYFNKQPRLGTLSTSSKDGKVNSAYFGSPYMIDEKTIIMGLTRNRTLSYLQENPSAVFMIMEPGQALSEWKGVRIYVKMTDCSTAGEPLEKIKARITAVAGEAAAGMIHAALTFEVLEVRPLADFGQGWEKSI